jgi:hypothetical protein
MSDDDCPVVPEEPEADSYIVKLEDGTVVNVLEYDDEFNVSADRKVQLDRYEPIAGYASLGGSFPEGAELSPADKLAIIMGNGRLARDIAEYEVMTRFEEHVREDSE